MTLSPIEYSELLRHDFPAFIERCFYELNSGEAFYCGPYIEMIATVLEDCRVGRTRRQVINLPPRYLKSHCVSVAFTAWLLGHNPAERILCASYGQTLSEKFARDCRKIMSSPWYQQLFPTRLVRQAVADIETTQGGVRFTTSVAGPTTGRGAGYLIIDDPQKPEDAHSKPLRESATEWFSSTLVSRLDNATNGRIIITMQRLHESDLVGHVTGQGGWNVLSLSAIAEADEAHVIDGALGRYVYRRKAGETLLPERDSAETFAARRAEMGVYNFSAQYQQKPIPEGGLLLFREWLRYYEASELPARFDTIIQSWDTANKVDEINDFSACTTWGVITPPNSRNRHFYLLHVFRARLTYPALKRKVVELAGIHTPHRIVIEDKASGTALIQDLKNEGVRGVTAYEPPPGSDKIMRMHAQSALFEGGQVLFPKTAPWLAAYEQELLGFPNAKFDDQVDSTTQALDHGRAGNASDLWRRLGSA